MSENQESLGRALGLVPSGLFIVTLRHGEETNALLASWVMQAGFEPPSLTVAVKKGRPVLDLLQKGAGFAVNVVGEDDRTLLKHFSKGFPPGAECYEGIDVQKAPSGVEILPGALAWMDCRPTGRLDAGDHEVVRGEITAGGLFREGRPTTWVRKSGFGY